MKRSTISRDEPFPDDITAYTPGAMYIEIRDKDGTLLTKKYAIERWDNINKIAYVVGAATPGKATFSMYSRVMPMYFPDAELHWKKTGMDIVEEIQADNRRLINFWLYVAFNLLALAAILFLL